jgi:hypothetical protein
LLPTPPVAYLLSLLDALAPPREEHSPGIAYLTVTALALMVITLTGHLGGILSGVETP